MNFSKNTKAGYYTLVMMTIPTTSVSSTITSVKSRVSECGQSVSFWFCLSGFKQTLGLVGGTAVESLQVTEGKVVGFNVKWNKRRMFAIDMGGFAINLERIFK